MTRPDGTFTVSETPFEIPSTFLLPQGVTHKEESIGQPERHSIMIDMKDDPPPAPAARTDLPPAVPMDGAAMMLDVERVKVWDVPLTQGQDMPLHVHNTDTVVVFLEGGSLRSIAEDGAEEDRTYAYKDVDYWPAGRAHRLVVVDGAPRVTPVRAAGLTPRRGTAAGAAPGASSPGTQPEPPAQVTTSWTHWPETSATRRACSPDTARSR